MKNYKGILIYIAFFCAVGCKTSENISEKESLKKLDVTTNNIVNGSSNDLSIHNLCDTITGKPRNFSNNITNGGNTTNAKIKDNTLYIEVKSDSIVYKDREVIKEVVKTKDVIVKRNVTPFKIWVILVLQFIVIILLAYLYIKK